MSSATQHDLFAYYAKWRRSNSAGKSRNRTKLEGTLLTLGLLVIVRPMRGNPTESPRLLPRQVSTGRLSVDVAVDPSVDQCSPRPESKPARNTRHSRPGNQTYEQSSLNRESQAEGVLSRASPRPSLRREALAQVFASPRSTV